jgi:hypothetical protein
MAEIKTKPTNASVAAHINAMADLERRKDCRTLVAMLKRVTGAKPTMWGPTIIGFGKYHYKYASGREGDMCIAGFASRGNALSVYLMGDFPGRKALLAKLGKHKMTVSCLYIRRLADVDIEILEQLIAGSVAAAAARHARMS